MSSCTSCCRARVRSTTWRSCGTRPRGRGPRSRFSEPLRVSLGMRINLVAIGRSMPDWVEQGWREYARRLPPQIDLELIALAPPAGRRDGSNRRREGRLLLERSPRDATLIALDGTGEQWSTQALARRME